MISSSRPAAPRPWREVKATRRDLADAVDDGLNAVRGYCEIARLKGKGGDELRRRMNAAIDAVDELSDRIRELTTHLQSTRR